MKKHLILVSLSTAAVMAVSTTEYQSFLDGKTLEVSGTFGSYNFLDGFAAGASTFDWAFTTTDGVTYQLRGDAPTDSSVFGWKVASIFAPTPMWYMMYTNSDIDGDGTSKYDWILVSPTTKAVYKLAGVSDSGSFAYSDAIDIDYTISSDGKSVAFGSAGSSLSSTESTSDFYQSIDPDSVAFRKPTQSECEAGGGKYGAWMDDECYASWESANRICTLPEKGEWLALASSCNADVSFVESSNSMFDLNGWYGLTTVSGIYQCIFSKIATTQNAIYFWTSSESEYDNTMAWYFSVDQSGDNWEMNDYPKSSEYKVRCKDAATSTTTSSSSSVSSSSSIANTTSGIGKSTFMMKDFPTCEGVEDDGQTYTLLDGMVTCADVGLASDYTGTIDMSGNGYITDYSFADTSDGFCADYQYSGLYASGKTCMIQMDLK